MSTPLWRTGFDLVERPLAAFSESWVQSDQFMDAAAFAFKFQRRVTRESQKALDAWLGLWGVPTRRDVHALSNQVARLERQVRELRS
jgi:polyhydroxyalkanoate synthesis regulator phasin